MEAFTKERKGRLGQLVGAGTLAVGLALNPLAATNPAEAGTKFILANVVDKQHVMHVAATAFSKKLDELSGGNIEVEYHLGGDLGDWVELFEQTMQGSIEMTQTWNASEFDKRLDLATLGYTVDTYEDGRQAFGPGGPMAGFWAEVFADLNMKLVGILPDGFYGIVVRKGVDAPKMFPADAKGFKLRVPPIKIGVVRFEALGFSAIPMPGSELYTAMQLGQVDGAAFRPANEAIGMTDIMDHYVRTNDIFGYSFWLANKDWWEGLSDADRGMIEKASTHAVNAAWDEFPSIDNKAVEGVKAAGVQVHNLTADELAAAKKIVYAEEWPWMEEQLGKETMDKVRSAIGAQ